MNKIKKCNYGGLCYKFLSFYFYFRQNDINSCTRNGVPVQMRVPMLRNKQAFDIELNDV